MAIPPPISSTIIAEHSPMTAHAFRALPHGRADDTCECSCIPAASQSRWRPHLRALHNST